MRARVVIFGILAAAAAMLNRPALAEPSPRLVFATYMTCCPLKGNDQSGDEYKAEIREAQKAGIDGFALDISYWPPNPRAKTNVGRLFDAAEELGSGFKLFIMADQGNPQGGLSVETMALLLRRYGDRPSYYRYKNKLFVSTYLGTEDWIQRVRSRATADGKALHVVPFLSDRKGWAIPAFARTGQLRALVSDLGTVDGYFSFRVVGPARLQNEVMAKLGSALKRNGKTYMAGVTPYYRRASPSLTIEDGEGVSKIVAGLRAATLSGADWVQLVTWNDWEESTYLQPFAQNEVTSGNGRWKSLLNHGPILSFLTPFIQAYKQGSETPVDADRAILSYRPALKNLRCGPGFNDVRQQGARDPKLEALNDNVYVAALLTKPGTIEITVGGKTSRHDVGAGFTQLSVQAREGPVSARLTRNGTPILASRDALPISSAVMKGCFNLYSADLLPPAP